MAKPTTTITYRDTIRFYTQAILANRTEARRSLLFPFGALTRSAITPYLASMVLAGLVQNSQNSTRYFVYLVIAAALGQIMEYIGINSLMRLQARSQAYLHDYVFARLMHRGTRYYANTISGKLTSDVTDFVSSFGAIVNTLFISALSFSLMTIVGLLLITINSWQLGLYLFVTIGTVLIWTMLESKKRSDIRKERLAAQKQMISHMSDSITNALSVKMFAREATEIHRSKQYNHRLADLRIRDWCRAVSNSNIRFSLVIVSQMGMLFLLIQLVRRDPSVLATGIFAFSYTLSISSRLFDLNLMYRQIEEAFLQAQPMTQMLLEPNEIDDAADAPDLRVEHGAITLEHVDFHYTDGGKDTTVFTDLQVDIPAGQRVGLVGPSGGGKSTFTRLLLRFDDVDSGTIRIDGQDIAAVTQNSLRNAVSYVPQEPLLFHRSILENIAYGKPEATADEVAQAARLAHADEFIARLPNGYDTIVGERGVKLSGGQRQRIAIARAILKDAPLLVLDEATSALDSESEVHIQKALWQLMRGRTAVVVAHRLSTIQKMDRILVLDNGAIIEDGTHQQLIEQGGLYATLWAHQSGGFLED